MRDAEGQRVGGYGSPAVRLLVLILLMLVVACGRSAPVSRETPATQETVLTTSDGVELTATVYLPSATNSAGKKPPALILVNDEGAKRSAWTPLAERAQSLGLMCVAFDMREHAGQVLDAAFRDGHSEARRKFGADDWPGVLADIDAAKGAVLRLGADPDNLALAGAGVGANMALRYAVQHKDIQALVMLSPGLACPGMDTRSDFETYSERPVLLVTTENDAYSASVCATLKKAARGFCELRSYAGSSQGTDILSSSGNAVPQVLLWLSPIIGSRAPD